MTVSDPRITVTNTWLELDLKVATVQVTSGDDIRVAISEAEPTGDVGDRLIQLQFWSGDANSYSIWVRTELGGSTQKAIISVQDNH